MIYDLLTKIGKMSGCHRRPDRSFFIKGKQFPVCARCFGAFLGYYVGLFAFIFYKVPIPVLISFCLIMFLDWYVQYKEIKESTNTRRYITGFLCGFALMQLQLRLIVFVYHLMF